MMVKPESLARHLKSDGHKRNAGLPLDRPEVCTFCNIAWVPSSSFAATAA